MAQQTLIGTEEVEEIIIHRDDPIVKIIETEKKVITKYDMLEDPKYKNVSEQCLKSFEALSTSLMVPLIFQDKVIGLLPAMKAPTVNELHGGAGFAIETVVPKSDINILIPDLRDVGATDILELPLSKIVP